MSSSRLLERARVLWRGPSPAAALPRSSGGTSVFLERMRVLWRGPAPAPALPRISEGSGGFLERLGVLWRGPVPAPTRRSLPGSQIAPSPCASAEIGSRAPDFTSGEALGPHDTHGCALLLAEVREINKKIERSYLDDMKWFKRVRELLITIALYSGLTLKECVEKLQSIWEVYNAHEDEENDDNLDSELYSMLSQIEPW